MDGRWRHLEIALDVCLSWRLPVNLCVIVDKGKVLPLPCGIGALHRRLFFNCVAHSAIFARNSWPSPQTPLTLARRYIAAAFAAHRAGELRGLRGRVVPNCP